MIANALVLSEKHIPADIYDDLQEARIVEDLDDYREFIGCHEIAFHKYGLFIILAVFDNDKELQDVLEETPEWLKKIITYCAVKGCDYINFDRDGDELELFSLYEH